MTRLEVAPYEIPAADLGPENPLPVFRDENQDSSFDLDESVPAEDRRYMGWRTGFRVLPYRLQDGYNRKRSPKAFRAIVLENDHLKATFLPELGGRLASLRHKKREHDLLERNPVFQPANLALRNAWFSGGIEWNTCQLGHYYLTCSPVFAARVEAPDYPVLRLYEWDRVKCFPWQIDFHLPPDSELLSARVRLVNPHETEIAMYWWTNIATAESRDARVLFPAETALGFHENRKIGLVHLPTVLGTDGTYSTNAQFAQEMFARIPEGRRHWVAHLDGRGMGLFETSTDRLRGRKMFCWGMNQGGRRWQEFLSEPGRAYIEIQAGLAATQLESIPMPAKTEWAWTEVFGLLEADPGKVHSKDWNEAWQTADVGIEGLIPRAKLDRLHTEWDAISKQGPASILSQGPGWGALERRRCAAQGVTDGVPAELRFDDSTLDSEQKPWLELMERGSLPEQAPDAEVGAYMIQPEWQELLEGSIQTGGDHWLTWLHLGVMKMESFDIEGARTAWNRSMECKANAWALRNLAVLEQRAKGPTAGRDLLSRAWDLGPRNTALALEYAAALIAAEDYEGLGVFLHRVPEDIRKHERMRIISAQAALRSGALDEVEKLFSEDFATIREGEVTLTDLWFEYHERRIVAEEGVSMDEALRKRVRAEFPPPKHIDFRIASDVV